MAMSTLFGCPLTFLRKMARKNGHCYLVVSPLDLWRGVLLLLAALASFGQDTAPSELMHSPGRASVEVSPKASGVFWLLFLSLWLRGKKKTKLGASLKHD